MCHILCHIVNREYAVAGKKDATPSSREQWKQDTRERIVDEALDLVAGGGLGRAPHDEIARRIGVARRTVYRYFADREALDQAIWGRLNVSAGGRIFGLPETEAQVTESLPEFYEALDTYAPAMTVAMSIPQGRLARLAVKHQRQARYRQALADATAELPPEDRDLAIAAIQLLRTGPAWLEMRDSWGLDAAQMTRAAGWAIRTLIADLKARKGKPLGD